MKLALTFMAFLFPQLNNKDQFALTKYCVAAEKWLIPSVSIPPLNPMFLPCIF